MFASARHLELASPTPAVGVAPARGIHFAFVRVHRVTTLSYLRKQEAHAQRAVPTAETRPRMNGAHCLSWSAFGSPGGEYVADYKRVKDQTGARERKKAALCLHILLGISPGWIENAGDLHDPFNPRVQALFRAAISFAERHFNATFSARLDLDERGGGVVDVFATHVHERSARLRKNGTRGPSTTEVSIRTALDAMSQASGADRSYTAIQTLWAEWARRELRDDRIVRGVAKAITGRRHLTVQEYRQSVERAKEVAAAQTGMLTTVSNNINAFVEVMETHARRGAEQDERDARQDQREAQLQVGEEVLDERFRDLDARERRMDERERGYTDWATERVAYESGLDVRYAKVAIVQAEGEGRLDQERAMFAEAKERAEAAADARAARLDRRDADTRMKALRLAEREAETERLNGEVQSRAADLEASVAAAHRSTADAEQRAARADAAAARYTTLERQLIAGLSLIAKGALESDRDLEDWPDVQELRPLLRQAFVAVDARTLKKRRSLHDEQQRVAVWSNQLNQRDADLAAQGRRLDQVREAAHQRSTAYDRGVALIASGRITTRADLDADRTLTPAAELLTATLAGVTSANDAAQRRALQMQEQATRLFGDAELLSASAAAQMRQAAAVLADGQRRFDAIEVAENNLAADRAASDRHAAAWRVGVAEIEAGRLRSADDIAARGDLAPAALDLRRAVQVINDRVVQRSRQAAAHIAAAGEERSRLAEEREQAREAENRALKAEREADSRLRQAEAASADAGSRAAAANRMRANLTALLSSVSSFVATAASRTDLPVVLAPGLKALMQAHKAYLDQQGRGIR